MTLGTPTAGPISGRPYRLLCGIPALAREVEVRLGEAGWVRREEAEVGLLVDGPWGVALQWLERVDARDWVVVTDNPCPEYWEDLWAYRPHVLLAGGHSVADLAEALRRAAAGEYFQHTPQHESPLTALERQLLRQSAMGWENRLIAREVGLSEGTVRNGLCRVFHKLGFENRGQAALYYWGLWHLLYTQPLQSINLSHNS